MKHLLLIAFLLLLVNPASCQLTPPDSSASQIRKEWTLGQHLALDLERRDGRINDQAIVEYVQKIADRIAIVMGAKPLEVRVTRGSDQYSFLMPHGVLYLSGSLLERIESEAELAGLLAHQLEHARGNKMVTTSAQGLVVRWPECVLASPFPIGRRDEMPERELQATAAAVRDVKAAGYEPSAILDLLSKLVYEHPVWAKWIPPADLLDMRAALETDKLPAQGYLIDSSDFMQQHANFVTALGHAARRTRPPSLELARKR